MIELKNISKNFAKFQALKDINLTCEKGQCIALIGPNGSGKTTVRRHDRDRGRCRDRLHAANRTIS